MDHLDAFLTLSPIEKEELTKRASLKKYKRRQFLLSEGEVCQNYAFVSKGCFKTYKVDEAGKEHNIMFAVENQWAADIGSFHSEKPSALYIEAVEPSEVLLLHKKDMIYFYTHFYSFNRTFRVMVEDNFVDLQNRLIQMISTTAEERYFDFVKRFPDLDNRLSNAQIASYIGITPEFLSRIRNGLANRP